MVRFVDGWYDVKGGGCVPNKKQRILHMVSSLTFLVALSTMFFHSEWRAACFSTTLPRTHIGLTHADAKILFFPQNVLSHSASTVTSILHPEMHRCSVILGCDVGTADRAALFFHSNHTLHHALWKSYMSHEERVAAFKAIQAFYKTRAGGKRLRSQLQEERDREAWADSFL